MKGDNLVYSNAIGVDVGAAYRPLWIDNLTIGLVGKDLNSPSFKTDAPGLNTPGPNYKVDPMYRLGINQSFWHDHCNVAVDYDLSRNTTLSGVDSQYLGGGVNVRIYHSLMLRVGAMKNVATSEGAIATAGLGFGIKQISLDIAAERSLSTRNSATIDGVSVPDYLWVSASLISRW